MAAYIRATGKTAALQLTGLLHLGCFAFARNDGLITCLV